MRSNVVQLRELLREKFPGVRLNVGPQEGKSHPVWPTGLSQIDEALGGGLPRGGITELLSPKPSSGSALVLAALLRHASQANEITVLIDGQDSFDPAPFSSQTLRHLLWLRCHEAEQALQAADFVLRDSNLPFVMIDLALNPITQLRMIPATTWYRFQRIVEQTATTVLVMASQKVVASADARLVLQNPFGLESLDRMEHELLRELRFELQNLRRAQQPEGLALEAI